MIKDLEEPLHEEWFRLEQVTEEIYERNISKHERHEDDEDEQF